MRLLVILLFCSGLAEAQSLFPGRDSAFVRIMDGLPRSEPFDTAHHWKKVGQPCVYIISDNDLYDHFGYELMSRYRDFDFANYHILGLRECQQCLLYCKHDEGRRECHRNACHYQWTWRVRDNKKAFMEMPAAVSPGHIDAVIPMGRKYFFGDTIMARVSDSAIMAWYTHAGGDCYARFSYGLLQDKYYPVLLLKELNYYGGCRSAGFWEYTVSFTQPAGIRYYIKRTIFMERYTKNE